MTPQRRVYPPAWVSFPLAVLTALAALTVLVGCGHTDSFTSPPYGTDAPFDPTPPVRLTLNTLADRGSAWLPDGSGILYSAQQIGRRDKDLCLALLPPDGGRQRELTCNLSPGGADSTDGIESAAPAADGRLAFVQSSAPIGGVGSLSEGVAIASTFDARGASKVQSLPYTVPGEPTHNHVSAVRWLGPGKLAFVGGSIGYQKDCLACPLDTVVANLKIVTLDAAAGTTPVAVPGTDFATGISPGGNEDEIYYTLGGDTRVFRRTLSTGEVAVAFDFGAAGIVRDVQVVGARMTAVVGGRAAFGTNSVLGPTQRDSGGVVHVVDLGTGTDRPVESPGLLFRRPALSPDGTRLVAEGYRLIILGDVQAADTTVSMSGDLYLFGAP